jgi:hypothetical protein
LDDNVYSVIVASKYEYKDADIAAILGRAYQQWRSIAASSFNWSDRWTDQQCIPQKPWGWGSYNEHIHNFNPDNSGQTYIENVWNYCYNGVSACNQMLEQIEDGVFTPENKENMIAELRVLRASFYYFLCDLFGNVPIVEKFNVPADFLPEQSTRLEVFNYVVKEIEQSLPYLADRKDRTTYGRFNKYAASALLATVYINAEVYSGTAMWQKCIDACNVVIGSGYYALTSTQKACFARDNHESGFSEAVFAVAFDEKYATGLAFFEQTLFGSPHCAIYGVTGGWGNGGDVMIPQYIDTFDEDDLRLRLNFFYGQQYNPDGTPAKCGFGAHAGRLMDIKNAVGSIRGGNNMCEEDMGYLLAKYEYYPKIHAQRMDNDVFSIRYADVLMMKAECLLRTGNADEAATIVTSVRRRAFATTNPAKATVTGDMLRQGSCYKYGKYERTWNADMTSFVEFPDNTYEGGDDIVFGRFLDELGWEFDQEGRRRQHLIRFKTTSGESVWIAKGWLSHFATHNKSRELFPINSRHLLNNPKLKQNPGY